jgi:nucleoside-diphosphate-sugar epimerase
VTGIRLFVFGLGYSATAFVREIRGRAASVAGTVRTQEKAERLKADGIDALVFDGSGPGDGVRAVLAEATHLLVSVAPGEAGDPVLAHHRADIAAAPSLRWIGYLSTVGVYGDYGGAFVSERTTPHPASERSRRRLAAEKAWAALAAAMEVPLAVFRIAGIYGPGRNALLNLAEGTAKRIVKPGQVFNRIHVADIAATLAVAVDRQAAGVFNLADDEPAPPEDVVAYAAALMGVPAPPAVPLDEAELTSMARSFYGDNKRVSNRKIREDLGVTLRYPTYREGLSALWRDGSWRGTEASAA